ncbi:MAG: hypothetical protein KFF73_11430 [Cyclobacteriaceae bacterium]|nr:hypothetical protein [Cyclobacteriaceae bacterium]
MTNDHFKQLISLSEDLKSIYAEIEDYRQAWDQYLKALIKKTFRIIQKNIDLNLKIIEISEIRNLETIRLTFGYLNSGLFVEKKKHNQSLPPMVLVKKGGYLSYSQTANGKISVFIHYPYIEDIYGAPDNILEIGLLSPGDITKNLIFIHAEQFLDEIVKWEKEEKKLIGFHTGRVRAGT